MISVSQEFRELMRLRTNFTEKATITFADGRELTLTEDDFTVSNNHVEDCAGANTIPLGSAIQKTVQLEFANFDDRFEDYDFFGAVIRLKCVFVLSNSTETVNYGKYTVTSPETYGSTVIVTASDDMYKAAGTFTTGLSFPVTAGTLLNDICTSCGISLGTASFRNNTFIIDALPEQEMTFRQAIGYIAMIAAGNARFNYNGYLEILEYNFPLSERQNLQRLDMWTGNLTFSTDDIVITGVQMKKDDEDLLYGNAGYVLKVENPFAAGKENTFLHTIGASLIGGTFRQFEGEHTGYPIAEFMDPVVVVDRNDNEYYSFLTDIQFSFFGGTRFKNSAEPPLRNSSKYTSAASQALVQARELVRQEKTARENAIAQLDEIISESSGLYTTTVTQPDQSKIFYLHDQSTLAESSIVWKMTAEAWAVSTDGGDTWNGGMTVDGDVIARILTSEGVNADWINAGTFVIRDGNGNVIFQASNDTHTVYINGASVQIGGAQTLDGAIAGAVSDANGYTDAQIGDYSTYVSNKFEEIEGRLDGQVESWFYPYVPTLSNAPASSWTTEALKENHEGDVFTDTQTEISYRFVKENGTWQWKVISDSVATQALAAAITAQDTADHKRRVFYQTPYPPYDQGDLWVQGPEGDILRCAVAKASGASYAESDWVLASKYTDDSSFTTFVNGDYARTISALQNQVDGKAETFYQATDPSLEWTATGVPWVDHNGENFLDHELDIFYVMYPEEANSHEGDLWHNTTDNTEWIWQNGEWQPMDVPDDVFDKIDGKAQIFGVQPYTPYHTGDLWFTGDEIKYCQTERLSGDFNSADWIKKDYYTDDSALTDWINGDFAETVEELQAQSDGKAETWYQATDPATNWTDASVRAKHAGDMWYNTTSGKVFRYSGSGWDLMTTDPPAAVFDTIDGKAQIYVVRPTPPYHVGDLWFNSTTSDIMTCITQRLTGSFTDSDWQKRNKYTDDSGLNDFVDTVYRDQVELFQMQIDNKVETWYQSTDPAANWEAIEDDVWIDSTGSNILDHNGDTFTILYQPVKLTHEGDFWHKTSDNTEYIYKAGNWESLDIPDEFFDMVDGKATIFTAQPTVPYNKNDMWFTGTEILVSNVTRETGAFTRSDWVKKDFYTDDSAFTTWKNTTYAETILELEQQADKKAETWYQSTDPSSAWTTPALKAEHKGDLWYKTTNNENTTWFWSGSAWQQQNVPKAVFDDIDGKAQIFVNQPVPPYDVGDLWFASADSAIKTCITRRTSGSYVASDWQIRNKYTDDSTFTNWRDNTYSQTISGFQTQIDGKIETWSQTTNPAGSWTDSVTKAKHVGDLWYDPENKITKRYTVSGSTYSWTTLEDSVANEASDLAKVKRRVFTSTPTIPYDKGDLWWTSTSEGAATIKMAKTSRSSGSFVDSDWVEPKYVDSSDVDSQIDEYDQSLGQPEIFNKLTNGRQNQGLYLNNGNCYVNASYILAGTLAGDRINGRGLHIINNNNVVTLDVDSNGNVTINATSLKISGSAAATQSYVNETAEDKAGDAITDYDAELDQAEVFKKLTNNRTDQGLYIQNGRLYIHGAYIESASIAAGKLSVSDLYTIGATIGGFTINSSSIYAEANGGNNSKVKYVEIKTTSGSEGKQGSITVRRNDNIGVTLDSGKLYSTLSQLRLNLTPDAHMSTDIGTTIPENSMGRTSFYGDVFTSTNCDFTCRGTKSAARDTDHYGEQTLYCYETPAPMFGDIGDAQLDDTGTCYVSIDDVFQEVCKTNISYYVFLQKCGNGDCWVEDRQPGYFIVKGTPGLAFSWEIKAKQTGYEYIRYNNGAKEVNETNYTVLDYEEMYAMELENITEELEG